MKTDAFTYRTVGSVGVHPVDISPCLLLSPILSQLFPPRDNLRSVVVNILPQRWKQMEFLTLEDGTLSLSRNVSKELPLCAA